MRRQTALKYDVQVKEDKRVEFDVPFQAGVRVTVFVIPTEESYEDLVTASETTLDFWNHPFDDEDWNNA